MTAGLPSVRANARRRCSRVHAGEFSRRILYRKGGNHARMPPAHRASRRAYAAAPRSPDLPAQQTAAARPHGSRHLARDAASGSMSRAASRRRDVLRDALEAGHLRADPNCSDCWRMRSPTRATSPRRWPRASAGSRRKSSTQPRTTCTPWSAGARRARDARAPPCSARSIWSRFRAGAFRAGQLARAEGAACRGGAAFRAMRRACCAAIAADESLPESEGLTAGRLTEIITALIAPGADS